MSELAKAYVQIVPSTKGVGQQLEKEIGGSAGDGAGSLFGKGFGKAVIGAVGALGVGKAIGSALSEGANFEQLEGGVNKIFKGSSDTVMKNAQNAFKSVGVSANQYMEQVTSFSASLLQSVGGDTERAAKSADMALRDMADNANTYGTDMMSIQNAYQGFAKQNYTMLDNLKLGYSGSKTEMERLLADAEKLTGVKYDINNLDDVYSAIHAIQEETGIAGTTAKEAEKTFSGSFSAMQASAQNLLAAVAGGGDVTESLTALISSAETFLFGNFVPMVSDVIASIPQVVGEGLAGLVDFAPQLIESASSLITNFVDALISNAPLILDSAILIVQNLITGLLEAVPQLITSAFELINGLRNGMLEALPTLLEMIPVLLESLTTALVEGIPALIEGAVALLTGIAEALPQAIDAIVAAMPQIVDAIVTVLVEGLPLLIEGAITLFMAIVDAIPQILPPLMTATPTIVSAIVDGLIQNMPTLLDGALTLLKAILQAVPMIVGELIGAGVTIVKALVDGVIQNVNTMIKAAGDLLKAFISAVGDKVKGVIKAGGDIVKGLWEGMSDKVEWIKTKIKGLCDSALGAIKSFFGIKSPSRVMRQQVGRMLGTGLGLGIEDSIKDTKKSIDVYSKEVNGLVSHMFDSSVEEAAGVLGGITDEMNQALNVGNNISGNVNVNNKWMQSQNNPTEPPQVIQNITVNKEISTAAEMAREIRLESRYGLMTGVAFG